MPLPGMNVPRRQAKAAPYGLLTAGAQSMILGHSHEEYGGFLQAMKPHSHLPGLQRSFGRQR
jgi:hypothetical protein